MTTAQKVIKYLAIAFAIFIIMNIAYAIFAVVYRTGGIIKLTTKEQTDNIVDEDKIITNIENTNISTLKLNLKYSNLTLKQGDKLNLVTNNKNITCNQNGDKLVIEEEKSNWFSKQDLSSLILYVPADMVFDTVKIETGAGEINIESLNTKKLSFEIGAGKVTIQNLNVTDKAKIEGGAGKVDILSGKINDLDLDMGVGRFEIAAELIGDNKIDAGIGKLVINLTHKDNYTITASKGIGSIQIDGKNIVEDVEYGDGENTIKIDGGIGSIDIDFDKKGV